MLIPLIQLPFLQKLLPSLLLFRKRFKINIFVYPLPHVEIHLILFASSQIKQTNKTYISYSIDKSNVLSE